jgi:hypothetical protein
VERTLLSVAFDFDLDVDFDFDSYQGTASAVPHMAISFEGARLPAAPQASPRKNPASAAEVNRNQERPFAASSLRIAGELSVTTRQQGE